KNQINRTSWLSPHLGGGHCWRGQRTALWCCIRSYATIYMLPPDTILVKTIFEVLGKSGKADNLLLFKNIWPGGVRMSSRRRTLAGAKSRGPHTAEARYACSCIVAAGLPRHFRGGSTPPYGEVNSPLRLCGEMVAQR